MAKTISSVAGRTFRWTFVDGPTAGKTYEHSFNPDGTVKWKEVTAAGKSMQEKKPPVSPPAPREQVGAKYASFEVAPAVHLVSYLSGSGYTLTVSMNLNTKRIHGFASNEKAWYPVSGTLEIVT